MTLHSFSELFAMDEHASSGGGHVDGTGVIAHQALLEMMRRGDIHARAPFEPDQLQPASIDLRLGRRAWRVRASFLPGDNTVEERIAKIGGTEIDLARDAVFESGVVYVVELMERTKLTSGLWGVANPKSSTGRLDVLARLITDGATQFDFVRKGYDGPLYVEVAPQAFSVVVRQGIRLNQLRVVRGTSPGVRLSPVGGGLSELYKSGKLVKADGALLPLRGTLVPVSIDLRGRGPGSIVGYKARKTTDTIDMGRVGYYDPREFWEKIQDVDGRLPLDEGEFYILATREDVGVPPDCAAEMVPFDSSSGEFRVHYAGFFDPGFGYEEGRAQGSKAVLEVRSYGVSFMLEHGQTVGWLNYSRLAGGAPSRLYGAHMQSNYQGQGVKLAKHFKAWPGS